MYLTEEEAKQQLCPFFTYQTAIANQNYESVREYPATCMGSACKMAWRWHYQVEMTDWEGNHEHWQTRILKGD